MNYLQKEWQEQRRGKGIRLALLTMIILSGFMLLQARHFPMEQGFEVFLFSMFKLNLYLLPLLCLFLSSYSILQEKEQKTLLMILTKKESYRSFLWKKSISFQAIILTIFLGYLFFFGVIVKFFLAFHLLSFFSFLGVTAVLIIIFNQIGMLLGSLSHHKMQLVGLNIAVWFILLFLVDIVLLYLLPSISKEQAMGFSLLYFLNPLHATSFFLETSLQLFSLDHLSRLMKSVLWLSPLQFLVGNIVLWVGISFEWAVRFHQKGEK